MTNPTTAAAAPQAEALDAQRSYAVLQSRVYVPVLLDKLAKDFNLRPETPEDLQYILQMAGSLRAAYTEKKAQEVSLFAKGASALNSKLTPAQPQPAPINTKAAADYAFNEPSLRAAALGLTVLTAQAAKN